ncbi:ISAs1 family transposase [Streptomyces sp. NPDC048473]|uniref:ISAs1 family transposase n=1 Tax=unclassified Streptomyces TaxID=2593676 RepID=UPI0037134D40
MCRVDGDAFDQAVGTFLSARTPGKERRAIAVDGKNVRGSCTRERPGITLLAAMDQHGNVLAQRQVADTSNEIPALAPLLDTIDLDGAVVTADALHSRHHHARYLRDRQAHYIAVIKANHLILHDRLRKLPWNEIRLDHHERTRAHHRFEIRGLKTATFTRSFRKPRRESFNVAAEA